MGEKSKKAGKASKAKTVKKDAAPAEVKKVKKSAEVLEAKTKAKTSGKAKKIETKAAGRVKTKLVNDLKVSNLKAAKYNPRSITQGRLDKLHDSLQTFGDLSGVVWNIRTKTLVSGHQRMKTIDGLKSKIIQQAAHDEHGTVSVGHIEAIGKNGPIRIPFRSVDWDLTREKAANVAANAHGGMFDRDKLAKVLADIEKKDEFDVEIVGLDPISLRTLKVDGEDKVSGGGDNDSAAGGEEFPEYNGQNLKTVHTCPKCSYSW